MHNLEKLILFFGDSKSCFTLCSIFMKKITNNLLLGAPFDGWLRGSSFACRSLTSVCCRQPPVVWFSAWFMYRFSWPSLLSFFGWYCMALVRACMVYCFMHAISRAVACCLAHHLGFVFVLFFFLCLELLLICICVLAWLMHSRVMVRCCCWAL